jgi:hypothetical protein
MLAALVLVATSGTIRTWHHGGSLPTAGTVGEGLTGLQLVEPRGGPLLAPSAKTTRAPTETRSLATTRAPVATWIRAADATRTPTMTRSTTTSPRLAHQRNSLTYGDIIDFLATTDVGRRIPDTAEE